MASSEQTQAISVKVRNNPGNPVFSCMFSPKVTTLGPRSPWAKPQNPLYRTSASDYGRIPPSPEILPHSYHPKSNKFSKERSMGGMYRNSSLNTALDRSRVYDDPNLLHTL